MPFALAMLLLLAQFGLHDTGELRLAVADPSGAGLQATVELVSEPQRVRERLETDPEGLLTVKRLPFGTYRVTVARDGFARFTGVVDVVSALPTEYRVALALAPVQASVTVTPDVPLLDPHQTSSVHRLGADALSQRAASLPGRSLADLVNTQPGWLLEANGVLHPRGSEYQTQYIVDGLPLTDNRSPTFAPEIGADDVRTMAILTGGYPAEYGRKLGGVIEVVTAGQARSGFHGSADLAAGSFGTRQGNLLGAFGGKASLFSVSAGLAATDRYLDPPVEDNFANHGTTSHLAAQVEQDLGDADRFGLIVRHGESRFDVPNEHVQQAAGQRQDRGSDELAAQFSYQHVFGSRALADVRGMARDLSSFLRSNPSSTPIVAHQDRGLRELYLKGSVSGHAGWHEWKAGGDVQIASVRERFGFHIADTGQFDTDTPSDFDFDAERPNREHGLFVQDRVRLGQWTIGAGLRWDHYRLVVDEQAISPRLAVAWSWPPAGLVVRGSYDRAFQTPAVENLLLASSPEAGLLNDHVLRLPVRPSRGDFYEGGLSKTLFGKARLDVTHFRRVMSDFADDDVLLNSGVSFPIAFQSARISGTEATLEVTRWRTFSGSISYARMQGTAELPVTGGLFLGDEAATLLASTDRVPVSQDQRHTVRAQMSDQLTSAVSVAMAAAYGSGLPVEFTSGRTEAVAQYGERIVDRVDFDAGRLRPAFSLDGSVALALAHSSTRHLRIQVDVRNLTNRLNVINFAGLFSGTALGPPRSVSVRLRAEF